MTSSAPPGRPSPCRRATTPRWSCWPPASTAAQPNQSFTVTYTDGTTPTFTQSISDWAVPQGYAGESTALTTAYRDAVRRSKAGPAAVPHLRVHVRAQSQQGGQQPHPAQRRQRRGARRHAHSREPRLQVNLSSASTGRGSWPTERPSAAAGSTATAMPSRPAWSGRA